jgi:predicted RNA-binding protein associated with RNAse of E/G family
MQSMDGRVLISPCVRLFIEMLCDEASGIAPGKTRKLFSDEQGVALPQQQITKSQAARAWPTSREINSEIDPQR